nr:hypothetical protein [Tanacetum cinerariifolium]
MIIPKFNREKKLLYKIDELRAISGHMLRAAGVQVPEDDLDNLQVESEEATLELEDPQELLGSILLETFLDLGFHEYTNVTTGLSVLLTIGMGSLGGTIVGVAFLVKGHTFPTSVNVHPVTTFCFKTKLYFASRPSAFCSRTHCDLSQEGCVLSPRLYYRGKDNGVNILKSIDEGPYKLETFRKTLAESTEGTPQFDLERPGVYSDLKSEEKDRIDFASWQQRIRLYCRGKDNGVNILKSIDEGPYKLGTFRETLAESTEGTPQFGPERPRVYSDLNSKEKDRQHTEESIHDYYVRFAKPINDMRNIKMTMSKLQLNSKFVNNMLPEWGRFVTAVKLNKGLRDSNSDQLFAYLKQHEAHAKENKMMNQATLQDGRVVVQNIQGKPNRGQRMNPWGGSAAGYGEAQNEVGNVNQGQARPSQARTVKCYNCNGTCHIERNCTQPKRPQNSEYFKDKMLLMQAQENEVDLDAEQLLFLADYDAFDSDVDEAPTAQTMFMANLSLADPITDEVGPSYDSDILSEVQDYDQYLDDTCAYQEEHMMHDNVQLDHVVDLHADYTSVSNMISYDQYVKDNEVPVVHSNASSVHNDTFMMIYNDMCKPSAPSVSNLSRNAVVKNSVTAELVNYREQVELYE